MELTVIVSAAFRSMKKIRILKSLATVLAKRLDQTHQQHSLFLEVNATTLSLAILTYFYSKKVNFGHNYGN